MFGHESKPCKVFEYGCLQPIAGENIFLDEIRRKHKLWNALVELEHNYRAKVRELLVMPDDPVPAMLEELEKVREEIKAVRKKERSGKVDVSHLKDRASAIKEKIKKAKEANKEKKQAVLEQNKPLLDELEQERRKAVKELTKSSGLYWINYEEVVNSYEQARRKAMREKTELKFHRWDGTGKVSVRFQKGLPVPMLFGTDTRLQVDPVTEDAWANPIRAERRKKSRTKIQLRVTSDENKKPVWIELPMIMHRPLHEESEVRSASIIRQKVGNQWRYKAVITATIEPTRIALPPKKGTIGIDLGWRLVQNGLRVAYWADDSGKRGQLVLGHDILNEFNKIKDLQSIRDQHFNEIKANLIQWKSENGVPDWLNEELQNLGQWRSPRKLAWLVLEKWKDQRFAGDEEIFQQLISWRKQENHLYDWEVNLRDQVQRRRREEYRKFASWLVKQGYEIVGLEKFDLRKVTQKKSPEEGTQGSLPMDRQRFIASVSELRIAIQNAFLRVATQIKMVLAAHSTTECHKCGHIEKFDASTQIYHTCPKCHELYDQDYNSAVIILHRALSQKQG